MWQNSNRARVTLGHTVNAHMTPKFVTPANLALRLHLLGGFRAERGGHVIPASAWLRRGAARTLVKLLAATPEHRLHREQILDLLWPEVDVDSALNRFGKALHAARRALEPELPARTDSSYLRLVDDVLTLNTDVTWIDVDHFEALAAEAISTKEPIHFKAALAAYPGELLPEDRYEDWANGCREALAILQIRVLLAWADVLEQRGAYHQAAERLRPVLEQDPLREELHRGLMRLYAASGSRPQALQQYQACRDVLRAELDAEPEPETEALYQTILTGGPSHPVPAGGLVVHATPLPSAQGTGVASLPGSIRRSPSTPTVGRDRVMEILREVLADTEAGMGCLILVSGEAGVGKSRLVADLAREAAQTGVLALWGASYVLESIVPYGPFIQAFESYLSTRPPTEREELAARDPIFARLIPSLTHSGGVPSTAISLEIERGCLFSSVASMLMGLTTTQPVLLVLDDLHATDAASLQLLHHLARIAADHRWLIIGTYREEDEDAGGAFHQLLSGVVREGLPRRISLRRLSRGDCDYLVRTLLPNGEVNLRVLDRLYALALGNPFFICELVQTMRENGHLVLTDGHWELLPTAVATVPRRVRDLVQTRVAHMGEEVRRCVSLAAVAGMESSFTLLHAAAAGAFQPPISEERLLDALDRAMEAHLLEGAGDGYAFRHPLLHEALYEQLSGPRRSHLHGAIAKAIEQQRPEDIEALAHHYARSRNEEKAVAYLERAGDRARALHAHEVAEAHYRELVHRVETQPAAGGSTLHAAAAHEKLGAVLTTLARYHEALEELDQATETYQASGHLEELGRATARIGTVHVHRGTWEEGLPRLWSVLESLEQTDVSQGEGVRRLYAALAWLLIIGRKYTDSLAAGGRASVLARLTEDHNVLACSEVARGTALLHLGAREDARCVLGRAIPLAEAVNDLDMLARALNGLAVAWTLDNAFDRSRTYLERELEATERLGDPARVAFMTYRLGANAYFAGDWNEARVRFERAVELGRQIGDYWASAYPLFGLAVLSLLERKADPAARDLEESIAVAKRTGGFEVLRGHYSLLAEHDVLRIPFDKPRAGLRELLHRLGLDETQVAWLLSAPHCLPPGAAG